MKIGKKEAAIPCMQGGMGVGISLSQLAGAVAKAGGVGIISTAQIGFREKDFDTNTKEANLRAMRQEFAKARAIAPDGILGFNIMVALQHYEEYVACALALGADIIVSGAGLPMELPQLAKEYDTALAPIVSSEKSAKVILKYWDKKYQRLPDVLVIEGPKAGGHLGFHREDLNYYLAPDIYEEEIKKILALVKSYEENRQTKITVVLAGGITTRSDVAYAMQLGVDGVQVATRFVTTTECDADIRYKQAYLAAKKEDIIIVKSPVGMPGRAIKNALLRRVEAGEKIPHTPCHGCLRTCNPNEIPYCITDALIHAAKGELDDALLFCGSNAYQADKIETVTQVLESLGLI